MNTFNKTTSLGAILAGALVLSACQSTPSSPVIQRANSVYETTGIADTKVKAQQNAIDSAASRDDVCIFRNKRHIPYS